MRKLTTLFLTIFLLLACSCSGKITEGEVISKDFTPAYNIVNLVPIVVSTGKITTTKLIPMVYHYNDKWEITIRAYNEKDSEYKTATFRVTEDVYNAVEIGYEFKYDKNAKPDYPEYTRKKQKEK